mmetsp:Transcript_24661/g.80626  ORF Transcript_24661/g.80626 Transcript_24661/m.80626 type:complete len:458 (+) Transcript_24661:3811-5184(+)
MRRRRRDGELGRSRRAADGGGQKGELRRGAGGVQSRAALRDARDRRDDARDHHVPARVRGRARPARVVRRQSREAPAAQPHGTHRLRRHTLPRPAPARAHLPRHAHRARGPAAPDVRALQRLGRDGGLRRGCRAACRAHGGELRLPRARVPQPRRSHRPALHRARQLQVPAARDEAVRSGARCGGGWRRNLHHHLQRARVPSEAARDVRERDAGGHGQGLMARVQRAHRPRFHLHRELQPRLHQLWASSRARARAPGRPSQERAGRRQRHVRVERRHGGDGARGRGGGRAAERRHPGGGDGAVQGGAARGRRAAVLRRRAPVHLHAEQRIGHQPPRNLHVPAGGGRGGDCNPSGQDGIGRGSGSHNDQARADRGSGCVDAEPDGALPHPPREARHHPRGDGQGARAPAPARALHAPARRRRLHAPAGEVQGSLRRLHQLLHPHRSSASGGGCGGGGG